MKITVVENSNPTYSASQLSGMPGRTFFRSGTTNEYFLVDSGGSVVLLNGSGASPVFVTSYGYMNGGIPFATYSEYKGELKVTITTP